MCLRGSAASGETALGEQGPASVMGADSEETVDASVLAQLLRGRAMPCSCTDLLCPVPGFCAQSHFPEEEAESVKEDVAFPGPPTWQLSDPGVTGTCSCT